MVSLALRLDILANEEYDEGGAAPLHRAAATMNIGRIRWLLFWNADINQGDDCGKTPIFYAAASPSLTPEERKETVYYLFRRGANLDVILPDGRVLEDYARTPDMKEFLTTLKNGEWSKLDITPEKTVDTEKLGESK